MEKIETFYPLSPMQQGLLFHALYEPNSPAYSYQLTARLRGKLSVPSLERAWQRVMERHAILRTSFVWKDLKEPVQVVHRDVPLPLEQRDWRELSRQEQRKELLAFIDDAIPIDLSKAPAMRLHLFRLDEQTYQFVWRYHHILLDGWSTSLVLKEVFAFYEAFSKGEDLVLPPSRPYRDHIVWLRQQNLAKAEAFWRRTLKGFTTPTELSIDRGVNGVSAQGSYEEEHVDLSEKLTTALQAFSKRYQLTVNTLIQGAWALVLSRYSGNEEVVFGATVSGRPPSLPGCETIVGLFINTLPIRVNVSPQQRVLPWLKELFKAQVEQREYEYSPLVQMQAWSQVPRGLPLFETLLVFENYPLEKSIKEGTGRSIEVQDVGALEWSHYPLVVIAVPHHRELALHITYDSSRFEGEAIRRLLEHLRVLLTSIVDDPEQKLAELNPLTEAERRQILSWNDTRTDYPRDKCIHELFEEQVEKSPEAVALVFNDQIVTYDELNRRANQLAHYLSAQGVGPEVPVGIMMNRSVELIVGLLGILKAGGAYVPLDPDYPMERLAFMLEDVQMPLLITEEQWLDVLPSTLAVVISLDADWPEIANESEENLGIDVSANNQAYVIYTSGSTGKPKGVSAVHRAVVRLVKETNYANFDASEIFLQFAPVSFDASTLEMWGSLLNGSRLVVMPSGPTSLEDLGRAIEDHSITTMWLTAGLFHAMVDKQLTSLKSVKQLLAGGDVLSVAHVQKFLVETNGGTLINGYGPTENTTFTCCHRMSAPLPPYESTVPIGRPVANTTVYILNEEMQPVIVGALGELYTGGDGLARGYVNHPEATAEKFVPNPFSEEPGARLYKTGDFVRHLEDGCIEFVGRRDEQVKVRGFRIELGEIQATLEQIEYVREAVVVVDKDRLVAYIVAGEDEELQTKLRGYLREKLPEHMVPAVFVTLSELPLTPNGKVDRRALPAPEPIQSGSKRVAPRTPVEELLVGIWAEVLGVEQPGIEDDFFELGGHSLLATQVISRIRQAFEVELPLRALFEASTPARLAIVVEAGLSTGTALEIPPVRAVARDGALPLSFAQQRLWFLDQLEPGSAAYNIPSAVRLKGSLDVKALEQSLKEVVRRHEVLRTTFTVVDGQPGQVIGEAEEFGLSVFELAAELSEGEREEEVQRLAQVEAAQPFDLGTGPLLRATLLRLSADEHVALLTMHHIVSDGWSTGILIRELAALYQAFMQGQASPLPELPIQYADYAVWQREWSSGEVLERQLGYWREQLAGAPAQLELPTDHARPAVQSFAGSVESFRVSRGLSEQLRRLSRSEGATLFMTLLAAFKLLLYRYTGQTDLVVGTAVANRNRQETEGLIGFFVNTLVLRTNVSKAESFRELLDQEKDVALAAYAHQDVPFERLVESLQPERNLSWTPLFQVMFVLQNAPQEKLELADLKLTGLDLGGESAKFDLTFELQDEVEGEIGGTLVYNRELYEPQTVRRMLRHYEQILTEVVTQPESRIDEFGIVGPDERQQLLVEWNQTARKYPRDSSVHELFEKQARRKPSATAIEMDDELVSYAELNRRANQLAHYLSKRGVKAESLVGVMMERSVEMVVALLGILKAGGAYVPLDAQYPPDRLTFMLEDAGVSVVITQEELAERVLNLEACNELDVIKLEQEWEEIARESDENLPSRVKGENLAYVIYTSGSTGLPKASSIPHRAVLRLVWNSDFAVLSSSEVFLQFAPISFDASTLELWGALLNAARLVLFPPFIPSHEELGRFLEERGITTLWLTAGLFHQMVDYQLESLGQLHQLLAGGDVLSVEHIRRMLARWPHVRLINGYGPTENTTFTCCHTINDISTNDSSVPIGRPISNTTVYLLDEQMQPVPLGVAGELYTGGDGLARCYLRRPELTAERFVPHPFSEQGERLYHTGDIARWRSDGAIEFLGRRDLQVKVRGFRIELGEVETALASHPEISDCVVIALEGEEELTAGGKRLVAYVVPYRGTHLPQMELSRWLKERIPEYMLPSAFVLLDELPLTANGKVDRAALRKLDGTPAELSGEYVAARTPVEELMAGIWEEVLAVEGVGVDDNFFELGGHSLAATQVISRIREVFGVEVGVRLLFERPTVADLADHIERQKQAGSDGGTIQRLPREQGRGLPLSFAQQRLWFLDQLDPGSASYNIPSAVRLKGNLDIGALERTLVEVIRRHEVLRTRFALEDGQPVQVIDDAVEFSLPIIDLTEFSEEEREAEARRLAEMEAEQPFDLNVGPLMRATLVRLSEEDHVALLTMHHIVSDGWSTGILIREIAALYDAYSTERESPLDELPIQYADYAVWQRQWLQGEVLEAQISYWREQLEGAPTQLKLRSGRKRAPRLTLNGSRQSFLLPPDLADSLKALSRSEGTTLFMVLLAAFKTLLYHHSDQTDIVVGTGVANRNRVETEKLLGFFLNSLALRTRFDGDPAFRELLERVRETSLEAYAHQELPFDVLVDSLKLERDLHRNPLFQVWFILQNTPTSYLTLPGLTLEPADVEPTTARFDLAVGVTETPHGLSGWIEYKTDLFDKATINKMIAQYEALLWHVVKAPDERLSELKLILHATGMRHRLSQEHEYKKALHQKLRDVKRRTSNIDNDPDPAFAPNNSEITDRIHRRTPLR